MYRIMAMLALFLGLAGCSGGNPFYSYSPEEIAIMQSRQQEAEIIRREAIRRALEQYWAKAAEKEQRLVASYLNKTARWAFEMGRHGITCDLVLEEYERELGMRSFVDERKWGAVINMDTMAPLVNAKCEEGWQKAVVQFGSKVERRARAEALEIIRRANDKCTLNDLPGMLGDVGDAICKKSRARGGIMGHRSSSNDNFTGSWGIRDGEWYDNRH